MTTLNAQCLEEVLAAVLVHATTHWAGWNTKNHFSDCGQSCPCCRWEKEETLGACDICEDFVSVKCVAKAWLGAARHIRCNNDKYLTVVYRYTDLPYDIMENIMGFALGHQNTLHSSWYPNGHYRDRRCGFGCRCCISLNTNRMGCWECNTYVRVKRVSFRSCLLSEYRSIKMKGRRH